MPQAVQAGVFRLASRCDDAGGNLHRFQAAVDDVGVAFDAAGAVGKHQSQFPFRADQFPFPQCVDQHRRQRDHALAGFRFGGTHLVVAIGALAHVELTAFKVDIGPAQPAQFRGAQSGKDCGQQ